jgi:hypothetical protein
MDKISRTRNYRAAGGQELWFLERLILDLEDGVDTFLRNVGSHTDYTTLYPRRWQSSDFMLSPVLASYLPLPPVVH